MRIHAQSDTSGNPVVQIIDLRPIGSSTGNAAQTRYRYEALPCGALVKSQLRALQTGHI